VPGFGVIGNTAKMGRIAAKTADAAKTLDHAADATKAADRIDDVADTTRAVERANPEAVADAARANRNTVDTSGVPPLKSAADEVNPNVVDVPAPRKKLTPGTSEHKADRWERYQARGGKKSEEDWGKQYDTNMRNYQHGLSREADYRSAMGATEGTLKTPLTNRQIDILKADERYAGQLKTGPVSLTKENVVAIAKDAELVKRGWEVEHILEKGASQPYLDALKKAGIIVKTGPQIP
jgi:hypothetical protein